MTYAPDDLVAVLSYFNAKGAPWASLGCVAGPSDRSTGGYHCGHDWLHAIGRAPEDPGSDYSYAESQRDRGGLTDAASAVDVGGASWWRPFTLWLVGRCAAGTPGTEDVREIIYTPDGVVVMRWDRLGKRTTGDSSHLYHTHISFFRDSEGRRSGAFLGLIKTFFEGADVTAIQQSDMVDGYKARTTVGNTLADLSNFRDWWYGNLSQPGNNPPAAGSRADFLMQGLVKLDTIGAPTDAQVAALVPLLVPALTAAIGPELVAAVKEALREGVA